ncbi:MAG: hypothetical protein COB99_01345 [Sulfurimonas sp.]|nr:MAG: hypothetical protein COB99_01345 [Sulfurimonas sp.]
MQITAFGLTYIFFAGAISWIILIIPLTTLLRYLTPKTFSDKYFCEPYFSHFEIKFYTGIPYYLLRTQIFMWTINFPGRIQKRGIVNVHDGCPKWFIMANRIYMWWLLIHLGGVFLLMIGLSVAAWIFPPVS